MKRHAGRWVLVGLAVLGLTQGAWGQEPSAPRSRPRHSLADRLGHLGRHLVGSEEASGAAPAEPRPAGTISRRPASSPAQTQPGPAPRASAPTGPRRAAGAAAPRSSRRTAQPEYAESDGPVDEVVTDSYEAPGQFDSEPVEATQEPAPDSAADSHSRRPPLSRPATSSRRGSLGDRLSTSRRPPLSAPVAESGDEATDEEATEHGPDSDSTETTDPVDDSTYDDAELTDSGAGTATDAAAADQPVARTARVAEPRSLGGGEVRRGSADDSVLVTQQSPAILVSTAGPRKIKVGSPAKYLVRLENAGNAPAEDLVVTIRMPEWAEVIGLNPTTGDARRPGQGDVVEAVQWNLSHLSDGSQAQLELEIVPRKSRPFDLNVQWTHAPVAALAQVEVQEAKLIMAISGPEEVQFGDQEMYKLTLSNPGTGDAENVVVRLLPTSPGDTETATHKIGTIAAGHTKVVELELTARDPGQLVISAEALADGGLRAAATTEILVRRAELALDLEGPRKQFAGSTATYKAQLSNPGNAVARNVVLSAVAPPGAKFLAASEGGRVEADGTKIVWRFATLRPGLDQTLAFRCRLETPGPNRPQLVCLADDDLKETAALTTEVEAMADLVLTVRDPSGPVPVGEDAEYEIRVLNRGKKAAEGVEFVAFFSEGVEPIDATGARYQLGPGQVVFEQLPLIDAGQEVVLTVRAKAQQSGDHVFRAQIRCQTLNTTLAGEESTHFYDVSLDDSSDEFSSDSRAADANGLESAAPAGQLEPVTDASSDEESVDPSYEAGATADEAYEGDAAAADFESQ